MEPGHDYYSCPQPGGSAGCFSDMDLKFLNCATGVNLKPGECKLVRLRIEEVSDEEPKE